MKPKIKLIYIGPFFIISRWKSKMLARKIKKFEDEDRYPMQWRNDHVLKKAKKFLRFLNVKIEIIGYENIPKATSLMIANHSSSIDALSILVALENPEKSSDDFNFMPVFLGKKELKSNKRFLGYMNILSTFYLDRNNPREALTILNDIASHAKENKKHIVIFPEGTRSKNGELQDFKSGAFRIAKKSFVPIVPITINNTLSATNLNRQNKLKIQIIFHRPIKPLSIISMQHIDIAAKVKTIIAKDLKPPEGNRSLKESKMV